MVELLLLKLSLSSFVLDFRVAEVLEQPIIDRLTELLHTEVVVRMLEKGRQVFRLGAIGVLYNLKLGFVLNIFLIL